MQIDLHTHILPKNLPDLSSKYGYPGWISTSISQDEKTAEMMLDGKHFRTIECNCWDAKTRILECNHIQVLSTIPVLFNYWAKPKDCLDLCCLLNNDIINTCNEYPGKFIGLCSLPMQAPDLAVTELKRCVKLGFCGVQIGSHVNDWNLDQRDLDPVWQACQDLDCPVFVHPWDMQQDQRMSKYWFPWLIGMPCETTIAICSIIFGGVLDRFPKIRFCFAHAGGAFPYTLGRIEHGYNVRPDLVQINHTKKPSDYLGRIWTDSLIHDHDCLDLLIKKIGIDRIMLGSDYPFPLGEHNPGQLVKTSNLLEKDKEKILRLNAIEFFGSLLDKQFLL